MANFFDTSAQELKEFARLTGNDDVHNLSVAENILGMLKFRNWTNGNQKY